MTYTEENPGSVELGAVNIDNDTAEKLSPDDTLTWFGRTGKVVFLSCIQCSVFFEVFILITALPEVQEEKGFSDTLYSLILALGLVFNMIYEPIIGQISFKNPPLKVSAYIMIAVALADLLIVFADGALWALLVAAPIKAGMGRTWFMMQPLVDFYSPLESRTKMLSLFDLMVAMGGALSAGLGANMYWKGAMCTVAGTSILTAIICLVIDGPAYMPRDSTQTTPGWTDLRIHIGELMKDGRTMATVWIGTIPGTLTVTLASFAIKFSETEFGKTESEAVFYGGLSLVGGNIMGRLVMGYSVDYLKRKHNLDYEGVPRAELYAQAIKIALVFAVCYVINVQYAYFLSFYGFIIAMGVTTFFQTAIPHNAIKLWSITMDYIPYYVPFCSVVWAGCSLLFIMFVGIFRDAGFSYPTTFFVLSQISWVSVILAVFLYGTNLCPGAYQYIDNEIREEVREARQSDELGKTQRKKKNEPTSE